MLDSGVIIGNTYQLERLLGQGAMGQVWLAHHVLLHEPRAIKFMLVGPQENEVLRHRFIQSEAKNALRLTRHPHIVRVYELGQHVDMPYMVMEYIEPHLDGPTFKEYLRSKDKLDLKTAGQFLRQLTSALKTSHQLGIIHRDIKPANIMVDKSGKLKLTDFGLTRDLTGVNDLTESGYTLGTPAYMAPEQAQGQPEARSDLYSVGILLYQMLTGHLPFTGMPNSLLLQHATTMPPSPRDFEPAIPPEVEQVILKALAKDPAERYNSVSEFEAAYRQAIRPKDGSASESEMTRPVTTRSRKLPSAPPPPPVIPNNLPAMLTSFVGRTQAVDEVSRLVLNQRLVTLVGAGGVGKTRLSLEVAGTLLAHFPNGVWLAELAPINDPALLPQLVLNILDCPEEAGKTALTALTSYLKDKKLLLVLDNCEHVIEAGAQLVAALLKSCPDLRILATSREALAVGGELAWRVPSLSFPDLKSLPPLEQLTDYEAIRLFVERASLVQPQFQLTEQNARTVIQICSRLDGIPLALELAAARVKLLPVEQLLVRLKDRFRLLVGGSRNALPRQQTLQALIDWSYELLGPQEKTLLNRLAVFVGGGSLEAIETVCADDKLDQYEIMEVLSGLVDKSLVVADPSGSIARYRLLETIRQYSREKLEISGEAGIFTLRHAEWCLALSDQAAPHLNGERQVEWLNHLESEHDNIRAALEWLTEKMKQKAQNLSQIAEPQVDFSKIAFRLVTNLWRFWNIRSYAEEGIHRLETLLELAPKEGPTELQTGRANGLNGLGGLYFHRGNIERSRQCHEQALALRRAIGDIDSISTSLANLGTMLYFQGETAKGLEYYEESVELKRQLPNRHLLSDTIMNLGYLLANEGQHQRGQVYMLESLAIKRELGDRRGIAMVLTNLSGMLVPLQEYAAALDYIFEALPLLQELDSKPEVAGCLEIIAHIRVRQEQYPIAARLYGAAQILRERADIPVLAIDRPEYEKNLQTLRANLDEATFNGYWESGRRTDLKEIIDYILQS